jgi:hypothetical protein
MGCIANLGSGIEPKNDLTAIVKDGPIDPFWAEHWNQEGDAGNFR